MGTCFGHFKKRHKAKRHLRLHHCLYFHNTDRVEFELLVDGEPHSSAECIADTSDVWCTSKRSTLKCLSKQEKKPGLRGWLGEHEESLANEGVGTQLVSLDAHTLLASRALQTRKISWSSSTPPSSIDLEWENEGVTNTIPRLKSQRSSSSNVEETSSVCGGGGSPESLEWDPGTDGETEQLICEIEQLTARALRETGAWSATESL